VVEKGRKLITRREFIRIAGITATSLAANTLPAASPTKNTAPPSQQLLSSTGKAPRPWWVKSVEKPTVEIDWDQLQRFDSRKTMRSSGFAAFIGQDEYDHLLRVAEESEKQRIINHTPGYTLKDQALNAAQGLGARGARSFLGPQNAQTPHERGVAPWSGSPEEASRMLRVAMRHFGAATIGFVELNEQTRKLIYTHDPDGKELVFQDTDQASETATRRIIPNKAKWAIVYTVQMSIETVKRAPTAIAEQTTLLSYSRGRDIQEKTQEFLRGLGYQCLGEATSNALAIAPALGVMAGLGELSRLNRMITPEFGPMVRMFKMITDLPLVPDQPIDAGIFDFCKSCKKCAEACPSSALSLSDEPSWETEGPWSNPGHKAFFENSVNCRTYMTEKAGTNCSICFAVCPFSKKNKVWLHSWIKAGVAKLPFLDGFLRSMDDAFSYGAQKDPEQWWWQNLPEYGIDTEQTLRED
jgi:epoxyqueuosine reductase